MTGSELRALVEQSNRSLREISDSLDVEPGQMQDLMKLGNEKLPLTFVRRARQLMETVQ